MEEHQRVEHTAKTNAGQGFGIAGLVVGLLALILAFIPCVGVIAIGPGAIAIVLSVVGLIQANQGNGAKGLIIAALVVSIVATGIAAVWGIVIGGITRDSHRFTERVERMVERTDREDLRRLEESFRHLGTELEKTFGDMEDFDPEVYEFGEEISDEEFEQVITEYEEVVKELAELVRHAENGRARDLILYSRVSVRAASLAATLIRVGPKLTEEQKQRFEEINKKYEEVMDEADI